MTTDPAAERFAYMKAKIEKVNHSFAHPKEAQEATLQKLLASYSQTDYGREHHSEKVGSYEEYKKGFPIQNFEGFRPYIEKVLAGNVHALVSKEPLYIGYTKGTTGKSKTFPMTIDYVDSLSEMNQMFMFNYSLLNQDFEWLKGYRLNLVSSGNIGTIKVGDKEMPYGYSLAVVSKMFNDRSKGLQLVTPTPEEMNKLPIDATKENWEKRYEFAYQSSKDKNVTYIMSTSNVIVGFGRYLYKAHGIKPKDVWPIKMISLGGFAGTHTRYEPQIKQLYGKQVDVREGYSATEGTFGTQWNSRKAWMPYNDYHFLEVMTINGIKQLHEMRPGEIGSLIVSTDTLPRYRIGDLILAYEFPYYRCIGRENAPLPPYRYGKV